MKLKIINYLLLGLVLVSFAGALGISPSKVDIFHQKYSESTINLKIINNENKELKLSLIPKGELSNYVNFKEQEIFIGKNTYEKTISYSLDLPNNLNPGNHDLKILVMDSSKSSAENILSANLGIMQSINVIVPYPKKYVIPKTTISKNKQNEEVTFTISVKNVGSKDIENLNAEIEIYNIENSKISTLKTNAISLKSKDKSKIVSKWIATTLPGKYKAILNVYFDEEKIEKEKNFEIGEPILDIDKVYIETFKLGTIAKFDINVKNYWGEDISRAYLVTEVFDSNNNVVNTFRSDYFNVKKYENNIINTYWDTKNIEPGKYYLSVKLYYLNRNPIKSYKIDVSNKKIRIKNSVATANVIGIFAQEKSWIEIILLAALFIVILVVIYFIIFKNMFRKKQKKK
ncbi:hypothetical protein HN789_05310 [archaeon]|jgi:hypothetical protein|nr:hypothetical protein [archaeon]MBT4271921.1 hypothetical protein [archaeon]MBT4461759.1 hypothetical protein [archaeon]MBT4858713.1 hypothetical protein [archaeon]MBT6773567.1 hypothetical protein [archaeon]